MTSRRDLLEAVESLQNMMLARATGEFAEEREYRAIRQRLLDEPLVSDRLPSIVRTCRTLGQFWPYIQGIDGTYAGRREHIWENFASVLSILEAASRAPGDGAIGENLARLDEAEIALHWQRALERRAVDPEGAITAARTLVESVCKIILEDCGVEYPPKADLPKLYGLTAEQLNLAPKQHDEAVFKRILGGAHSIVDGLSAVRNRYGDSHGKGRRPVKPSARHAELAVNVAGALSAFLAASWRERRGE